MLILLVFVCATTSAQQVYRRIGPDGQVYFSDQPSPDAERIEVTPAPAIRLTPVPGQTDATTQADEGATEPQDEALPPYTDFTIASPVSEQAVRANDGNVTVRLSLQPDLMPGHRIALKVDGEDGKDVSTADAMSIELSNLSRGRHTIEARVVDDEGNELIQAGPVTFYVLRAALGG